MSWWRRVKKEAERSKSLACPKEQAHSVSTGNQQTVLVFGEQSRAALLRILDKALTDPEFDEDTKDFATAMINRMRYEQKRFEEKQRHGTTDESPLGPHT